MAAGSCPGWVTTWLVRSVTTPSLSTAISRTSRPRMPTCSSKMGVTATTSGDSSETSSLRPPIPASKTHASHALSIKCRTPAMVNSPVGERYPSLGRSLPCRSRVSSIAIANMASSVGVMDCPFTRMRSRWLRNPGLVTVPTRKPAAASAADEYAAAVPFPLDPTTTTSGTGVRLKSSYRGPSSASRKA